MRLLLLSALFIAACTQSPTAPSGGDKAAATGFLFSKQAPVSHPDAAGNWCKNSFTDAVLINVDTSNTSRRYFLLDDGVHRIATQLGNMTSSFLLRKKGNAGVELFTSDNFPYCLSRKEYFSIAETGAFFRYDNEKGINYTVELQNSAEGTFVILVFPPDLTYGLNVHRCIGCR